MDHIDNFYKRIEYLKSQKVVLDKEIELLMNKEVETMDIGEFLKICKYFEIIPSIFFNYNIKDPILFSKFINEFKKLNNNQRNYMLEIIKDINKNKNKK